MDVLQFIAEAEHQVPASAAPGTRWAATSEITTARGEHTLGVATHIDATAK